MNAKAGDESFLPFSWPILPAHVAENFRSPGCGSNMIEGLFDKVLALEKRKNGRESGSVRF
jgi:hypothetical protein